MEVVVVEVVVIVVVVVMDVVVVVVVEIGGIVSAFDCHQQDGPFSSAFRWKSFHEDVSGDRMCLVSCLVAYRFLHLVSVAAVAVVI